MFKQFRPLSQAEAGVVLITGLMLVLALSAIGVTSLNITSLNQDMSASLQATKQAFYVAEAGLQHANRFLGQQSHNWGNYAAAQTLIAATPLGALGTYSVSIEDAGGGARRLRSTGTTPNRARAVLEALFHKKPLACGVCTKVDMVISGGGLVDSFDSGQAPYDPATAFSHGHLQADGDITVSSGGTLIKGNAAAGGTVTVSGGATVTGTTTEGAAPHSFPPVTACGPPYSPASGISGGSYDPATGDLTASDVNVTLASGSYCFNEVTLSGGGTLTVAGPVHMALTGEAKLSGGGVLNTTAMADNLSITSSYVSDSKGVTVSGGSYAFMSIYAPEARVTLSGGSHFYGAITSRYLTNSGGTSIHIDEALQGGGNGGVSLVAWRQIF